MKSELTKAELVEFAKLNKKAKNKSLMIRLTTDEYEKLKELHLKHGTPMGESVRRSLFKTYFFKGIAER